MNNDYIVAPDSLISRRFWEKVDKGDNTECWTWLGALDRRGYGRAYNGECVVFAHRLSWIIANQRPIPDFIGIQETVIRHLCNNSLCVNPSHLSIGTGSDNHLDAMQFKMEKDIREELYE